MTPTLLPPSPAACSDETLGPGRGDAAVLPRLGYRGRLASKRGLAVSRGSRSVYQPAAGEKQGGREHDGHGWHGWHEAHHVPYDALLVPRVPVSRRVSCQRLFTPDAPSIRMLSAITQYHHGAGAAGQPRLHHREQIDVGIRCGRRGGLTDARARTGLPKRRFAMMDPATERRKPCLFQVGAASARARRAIGHRDGSVAWHFDQVTMRAATVEARRNTARSARLRGVE